MDYEDLHNPETYVLAKEHIRLMEKYYQRLTLQQETIIRTYLEITEKYKSSCYGKRKALALLGKKYNVTEERINQVLYQGLHKLFYISALQDINDKCKKRGFPR